MHNQAGYQPAGYQPPVHATVVVVPATRMRAPAFLQQGVRVGGMMLGYTCVVVMGLIGIFLLFISTVMLATANYDDDFWDKFDRDTDPIAVVGGILMVIGFILIAASIAICFHARKKYRAFGEQPGRVINPNPGGGYIPQPQPAAYPPYQQVAGYPPQSQPAGYIPHPQPAGYPPQPQPAGYPSQPQPAGYPPQFQPAGYPPQSYSQNPPGAYPGQPQGYPERTTSYTGPPAPYPGQSGDPTVQMDSSYPVKPQQTNMPYEYTPPPPHAPASDVASAPPPYKP